MEVGAKSMITYQKCWIDRPNGRARMTGYTERYSTRQETEMMVAIYKSLGKRVAWEKKNLEKNEITVIIEETRIKDYVPKTKRPRKRKVTS
tara:strand:- start:797 stop:1069 length:273 start_codon:yes stop_codon:yes gene_type:complete